jgi:type III secretion protein U
MAGQDSSQEKNEKPTQKRLEDARKEGQTVKSKELTSFFSLISIFGYFVLNYSNIIQDFHSIHDVTFKSIIINSFYDTNTNYLVNISMALFSFAFKILIIPVAIATVLSAVVAAAQVGGIIITPKAMEIKFDKFNIVSNAKNIFSAQSMKKFGKDMVQLTTMSIISFFLIARNIDNVLYAGYYNLDTISKVFFKILAELFIYLLITYFIFAIIDYIIEHVSFMKKMMMSLEDIKKEMKDTEVSSQVKQRQREIQYESMQEDAMGAAVKNSTMVITNPTHIAIVIYFDPEKVKLPVVILKTDGKKAEIVRNLAKKYEIPIIREVWLARQLFKFAEVKKYVPSSLISPVADLIGRNIHLLPKHIKEALSQKRPISQTANPTNNLKKPG